MVVCPIGRVVLLLSLFLLMASLPMASAAIPIPGKLMVIGLDFTKVIVYFMEGDTDNVTPAPAAFYNGDIAPNGAEVAYIAGASDTVVHIWKAGIDGSSPMNLTEHAGLGGVNCFPRWSPDGSRIAFQHSEPQTGQRYCDAGFHLWTMNADGTGACPVTAPGFGPTTYPVWMSNGSRLLCESSLGIIFVNTDGTDVQVLPNVGASPALSPDGAKIVSSVFDYSESQQGTYRRLVVTRADGSNPQVLAERFISDADVVAHLTHIGLPADDFNMAGLVCNIGPVEPQWAPTDDLIVFSAAMPLDVEGPHFDLQREVWMYSFTSSQATRITTNAWSESGFSWHGDNTYPNHPTVTVDNTTIAFDQVDSQGLTTIILDSDPPTLPSNYRLAGQFYEADTTAGFSGSVRVLMRYRDEELPAGIPEGDLRILHYSDGGYWEDVTDSTDTVNNAVHGTGTSLSPLGLAAFGPHRFADVLPGGYGAHGTDPFWAYPQIDACVGSGIVQGFDDGTYQPTGTVTRDQMAVYISRALAGGDANVPAFSGSPTFSDVGLEHWALRYVEYAVDQAVVAGYADNTYHPEYPVDRGQMTVFIARALGWVTLGDAMDTAPQLFPDVPAGFWAGTAVKACVDHAVVQGYDDGSYRPGAAVTRDQMAVYVARAFGLPF